MIVFFHFFLGSQCKDVLAYLRNSKEGVNQERKKEKRKKRVSIWWIGVVHRKK
jgi:hypothetical protein